MWAFLSDFGVLFLIVATVALALGWHMDLFQSAPTPRDRSGGDTAEQSARERRARSGGNAAGQSPSDDPSPHDRGRQTARPSDARTATRTGRDRRALATAPPTRAHGASTATDTGFGPEPGSRSGTDDPKPQITHSGAIGTNVPDDVHPAVASAARATGIASAQRALADHWAIDTIKSRPGWLLFDVRDFLGESGTQMTYLIPGSEAVGRIDMYPIDDVRRAERDDPVLSASRRRVIEERWRTHRARRQNRRT